MQNKTKVVRDCHTYCSFTLTHYAKQNKGSQRLSHVLLLHPHTLCKTKQNKSSQRLSHLLLLRCHRPCKEAVVKDNKFVRSDPSDELQSSPATDPCQLCCRRKSIKHCLLCNLYLSRTTSSFREVMKAESRWQQCKLH